MDSSWVSLTTLHPVDHKARTTNDHFRHTWVQMGQVSHGQKTRPDTFHEMPVV